MIGKTISHYLAAVTFASPKSSTRRRCHCQGPRDHGRFLVEYPKLSCWTSGLVPGFELSRLLKNYS
jgi:hypothetical protein